MSNAYSYKERAKYGGMDKLMVFQMNALEDENGRLIADLDMSRYQTIAGLYAVLTRCGPLLEEFATRSQGILRDITDYITNSLGLFDREYESKHNFTIATPHEL